MRCDDCGKREATFHSKRIINGVTTEMHLCSECQKKYSGSLMNMFDFGSLFGGFDGFFGKQALASRREEYVCPSCGTTGEEFLQSGFVGCSDCYKEFATLVMPVIKRMQGDVCHVGKVPLGVENSASAEYERLKKELEKVIEREEYEKAGIIRDRMHQLKGDNNDR